ncbi:MAG: hypothetical protein FJ279_18540 [Planctomycetes bacterium]|nr:hypothetical protein [Planctomycetota bacterium]
MEDRVGLWMKMVFAALVGVLVMAGGAQSQEMSARLDAEAVGNAFDLADLKASPGGTPYHATWLKEKQKTRCTMTVPLGKDWKQIWIEFVPAQSGEVQVCIMAGWTAEKEARDRIQAWTDDVEVTGASLKNGGFEDLKDGKPVNWLWNGKPDCLSTDGTQAHGGKNAVKVWHDQPLYQTVKVEAGKPCRVSAWFKPAAK